MNWMTVLLETAEKGEIPARPATMMEALELMGTGWGCIFIVILVIIAITMVLNRVCREKK